MLLLVLPTLASIKWTLEKVTESIALYCQSSSKQAWQNSSYFSRLHCAIYTYNMAKARLNTRFYGFKYSSAKQSSATCQKAENPQDISQLSAA